MNNQRPITFSIMQACNYKKNESKSNGDCCFVKGAKILGAFVYAVFRTYTISKPDDVQKVIDLARSYPNERFAKALANRSVVPITGSNLQSPSLNTPQPNSEQSHFELWKQIYGDPVDYSLIVSEVDQGQSNKDEAIIKGVTSWVGLYNVECTADEFDVFVRYMSTVQVLVLSFSKFMHENNHVEDLLVEDEIIDATKGAGFQRLIDEVIGTSFSQQEKEMWNHLKETNPHLTAVDSMGDVYWKMFPPNALLGGLDVMRSDQGVWQVAPDGSLTLY